MIHLVYTIRDSAANAYLRPMFVPTEAVIIRALRNLVERKEEGDMVAAYPDQYSLYKLGTFNDATAELDFFDPQFVGVVSALIAAKESADA